MGKVIDKISQKGSMMVEAIAMLGLITMVTPILYKKAAERTTELQDINTAAQLRSLSKALDEYISDNYENLSSSVGANSSAVISNDDIAPYLPHSFNVDASKLFDKYEFAVRHDVINQGEDTEHSSLTGAVLGNLSEELPRIRSAKIASMVGANGGVVDADGNIGGVQGGWETTLGDFGFSEDAANGSLVTMSTHAVTSSGDGASANHVLYRDDSKGVEYNTMQTALYMGENPIEEVTRIIAANGTVEVTGGLDVSGALTASSAAISGALEADSGSITNLLKAGSAEVTGAFKAVAGGLTADSSGVRITEPTTLSNTLKVTGATTLESTLKVTGATTLDSTLNVTGETMLKDTLTVYDGKETTLGGDLTVKGDTQLQGELEVDGDITAPNIIGTNSVSAGGGNFVANTDSVTVTKSNINLAEMIKVSESDVTVTSGSGNEFKVGDDGSASLATNAKIDITSPGINIGNNDTDDLDLVAANIEAIAGSASIELENGKVEISNNTKISLTQNGNSVTLSGGGITIDSDNLYVDDEHFKYLSSLHMTKDYIVFADPTSGDGTVSNAPEIPDNNSVLTNGVHINRKGIIHLPPADITIGNYLSKDSGQQDKAGYIKLDRIIANRDYTPAYGVKLNASGTDASNPYDAYQVNPAYTSVMHDIKLTTRGGARLSDILPDFINKGIYVLDNTFKEGEVGDWSEELKAYNPEDAQKLAHGEGVEDCDDADCIASPWLGFVPTPQCPPGYAKVITINPIRWKMAEAFYVPGIDDLNKTNPDSFRKYFVPRTDPTNAAFKIYEADGSGGLHHHVVESGWPLTFQTNTWLNTTISAVKSGDDFWGWHAIMGFLYYGADYENYLNKVNPEGADLSNKVVWNLFPVYNEELTAIANVYCFFDRRLTSNSWDKNLVDTTYDQIDSFRAEHSKGDNEYTRRLNDPALSYDEAW